MTTTEDTASSAAASSEELSDSSSAVECKKNTCLKDHPSNTQCLKKTPSKKATDAASEESVTTTGESDSEASCKEHSSKQNKKAKKNSKKPPETSSDEQSAPSSDEANGEHSQATSSEPEQTQSSNASEESSKAEATSDGPSTDAEPGNESSNANESTKSAVSAGSDASGWTLSEDTLLRSMKTAKENLPWADIGEALKRGKGDVKARWKVIKDLPHQALSEEDGGEEPNATKKEGSVAPVKEKIETKGKKHKRPPKTAETSEPSQANCLSGDEASSEASSEASADDALSYRSSERRRQDRYLRKHIWSRLYPSSVRPRPDDYFDEADCAVLAAVHGRHTHARWLEMQANFYNATGRMVPLDVIRARCEGAEGGEAVRRWADGVARES
ncbi:hypothetical protein HJFPF1_06797 [Paramyrothecium foliicola]|nr:hypothetical protein HJFPF1_06797 [Paramyrothecium foliicola]